jgi:hypothetical protein
MKISRPKGSYQISIIDGFAVVRNSERLKIPGAFREYSGHRPQHKGIAR